MSFFIIITILMILICKGFYKKKFLIWLPPFAVFILEIIAVVCAFFSGKDYSMYMAFQGSVTSYFLPVIFVIGVICSSVTAIIRFIQKRRKN